MDPCDLITCMQIHHCNHCKYLGNPEQLHADHSQELLPRDTFEGKGLQAQLTALLSAGLFPGVRSWICPEVSPCPECPSVACSVLMCLLWGILGQGCSDRTLPSPARPSTGPCAAPWCRGYAGVLLFFCPQSTSAFCTAGCTGRVRLPEPWPMRCDSLPAV